MEPKRGIDGKYHLVYKTTVVETGRFYIGKHSTRVLDDGYFGSGKLIGSFIKKYGISGLNREILAYCNSAKDAFQKEKEIIGDLYRLDENCMNLQPGGGGGFHSEEHQRKCSSAGNKGLKKKLEDPEFRAKFSEAVSKSNILAYEEGRKVSKGWASSATQKAQSPEAREKRKNTFEKIGHQQGEKNSNFGKRWSWANDGVSNFRVEKDNIDSNLNVGLIKQEHVAICKTCGSSFTPKANEKFCSTECKRVSSSQHAAKQKNEEVIFLEENSKLVIEVYNKYKNISEVLRFFNLTSRSAFSCVKKLVT